MRTERLAAIGRVTNLLRTVADAIGAALFLTAFGGFVIQVFWRYALNHPLRWTEEVVMIAFIWAVFWAAAVMVPIRGHVSFDVVYDLVRPRTRRVFMIVSMVAILGAFLLLIGPMFDYLDFLQRKKSAVLRLPMHWIYGCYAIFVIGFTLQAAYRLLLLLSRRWEDAI